MAVTSNVVGFVAGSADGRRYALGGLRFDWTAAALSAWVIGGAYLDGWAHNHGKVDDVFITPWHAVLYGGVLAMLVFLGFNQYRNMARGSPWRWALPRGYLLSLAGAALFVVGGGLDFIWHSLFGVEVNIEALLSPTHLVLMVAAFLMISGPLRASWARWPSGKGQGWANLGPMILSAALILSLFTFFTQFAHPIVSTYAGKAGASPQVHSDVYVMNPDGTAQTRLTIDRDWNGWGPAPSPDGRKIAFTSAPAPDTPGELFIMNVDGSGRRQLTHNGRTNYLPSWSPDGMKIAFISQTRGVLTSDVYLLNADGTDEKQMTHTKSQEYGVSWSPDGSRLAFGSKMDGSWQIYLMNADGSQQTRLAASGGGNAPAWSPDGNSIAFTSNRYGNDDIFVIDADGSNVHRLTADPAHDDNPAWSPDGSKIVFGSSRDGEDGVYLINADGSSVTDLTRESGMWSGIPAWSRSGNQIFYTAGGNPSRPPVLLQRLEIASILLQSAILMGILLLLARPWRLPFGAITVIIGLSAALVSTQDDHYTLLPAALLTGVMADVLLWELRPSTNRRLQYYLFAFVVPVLLYGLYFLTLQLTQGIAWTIHLWLGSIFMAGGVGLLTSFLGQPPLPRSAEQQEYMI